MTAVLALGLFLFSLPGHYSELMDGTSGRGLNPDDLRPGLDQLGLSVASYAAYVLVTEVAFATSFAVVGFIIFLRRSEERMTLVFSLALVTFGATFPNTIGTSLAAGSGWKLVISAINFLGFFPFFLLLYLFPDGRFVPGWMRWPALAWLALGFLVTFIPGSPFDPNTWPLLFNLLAFIGLLGSMVFAQVYRYRRMSGPIERQQTKWVVFGFTVAVGGFISMGTLRDLVAPLNQPGAPAALYELVYGIVIVLCFFCIPLSVGVAILRYRLWDIDIIINRALVYGTLTASVIGIYVLVVGYLGTLFRTGDNLVISLVATGIVAVLFQPLRDRLQRGVDRLMYGDRDDPYGVISRLGQRLGTTLTPEAVLPTIVETVAQALKLPYVAIALKQGNALNIAAAYGEAPISKPPATPDEPANEDSMVTIPLTYQSEIVGALSLAPRSAGESFSRADHRLLEGIAQQAGIAAYAVRLTADLQRSRERLVTLREEERRRLRRDLHDGIGPALASLMLQIDAARNLLDENPGEAGKLLIELRQQTKAIIADIRRVVYELRPPALDDLGLIPALRQFAAQCSDQRSSTANLQVQIEAPDDLPALPAALEVAIYRIVLEALTNVTRHSQARRCVVRVAVNQGLTVEVVDDGLGLPADYRAGVGLQSMRERAEELGGSLLIEAAPGGGTRILARFPTLSTMDLS